MSLRVESAHCTDWLAQMQYCYVRIVVVYVSPQWVEPNVGSLCAGPVSLTGELDLSALHHHSQCFSSPSFLT